MEDKKLNRVFDRVKLSPEREEAMLADLLREKKEVSSMKQTNRRRIPAAALVAALVISLAGTALAVEYFGRVKINLIDNWTDGISDERHEGYAVDMPDGCIPVESLPEEVLAACPEEAAIPNRGGHIYRPFTSWSDGEAFLGLKLADNTRLEQMGKRKIKYTSDGQRYAWSHCLANVAYYEGQPISLDISASYVENNCFVSVSATMNTSASKDHVGQYGVSAAFQGETGFQEYVTPSGLEVTIYSEVVTENRGSDRSYDRTMYMAHFIKNNALFTVQLLSDEAYAYGRENMEFLDPWDTLIEILDAYE